MDTGLLNFIMLLLILATFVAVLVILNLSLKVAQTLDKNQWMVPAEIMDTLSKMAEGLEKAAERQEQTGTLLVTLTNEVLSFQQERLKGKK